MKTAIFLGAGASKADGAPLQSEILHDYFSSDEFDTKANVMDREMEIYFKVMFDLDVQNKDNLTVFPKFEEAIGMLDLAKERGESFRAFGNDVTTLHLEKIDRLRLFFVMLMAKIIDKKVRDENHHRTLVGKLIESGLIEDTIFVSTNYDLLMDNALDYYFGQGQINYGIGQLDEEYRPNIGNKTVEFLKIHGSLDWLYCPICNKIERNKLFSTKEKIKEKIEYLKCDKCGGLTVPIMVPPTYYKEMNNIYLSTIWHRVEQRLLGVDHIIFCGYSFPNADMHIKYLLKRVQVNREPEYPLKITIINDFKGKESLKKNNEANRYKRFFGQNLDYLDISFEEFAANPVAIMK
ncbi:MAG: SIR2 family protein [Anaerovoracaceae bacterium]